MIPYGGVNLQLRFFLPCTLSRGEWSFLRFGPSHLGDSTPVPIVSRLGGGGSLARTGPFGEEINHLYLPEIESFTVCSLAAMSTSLSCLRVLSAVFLILYFVV